jgi:hypothetical protein
MKWTSKAIGFDIEGRPSKRLLTGRKYSFRYLYDTSRNCFIRVLNVGRSFK